MFKRIVSNLPFSPALISQLGFYAKRLRKEEVTRKLAFIFIAMTLVIQSLAMIQPTESANASSDNDMVTGGVSSLNEYLDIYDDNVKNIHDVMDYAGITREEIANAKYGSWQIGETISWGFVPKFSYDQGERQHNIITDVSTVTIYSRPQKLWSSSTKTVYGWTGYSENMGWFAILESCGNLVTTKLPIITIVEEKCIFNPSLSVNDEACKPCPGNETLWINDELCKPDIVKTKSAVNISQGNKEASSLIAKAGDRISFTITIENKGLNSDTVELKDNLSDTLEYSTLLDSGGGNLSETTKVLSWPSVTLNSGDKQTRTFSIKLLTDIPEMAQGKSDGTSYDCKILNTFGNSITINVDCPTTKIIEQVITELPTTGPTESIFFSCIILAVAAYFFARTRQLEKEIKIIRNNNNTGIILLS